MNDHEDWPSHYEPTLEDFCGALVRRGQRANTPPFSDFIEGCEPPFKEDDEFEIGGEG
mgnify:CR=1 FL=1